MSFIMLAADTVEMKSTRWTCFSTI